MPLTLKNEPHTDGRVARSERNTDAIIKALRRLYARGQYTPTVEEVAALAGVTRRSVYNRFPDTDSIAQELGNRQLEAFGHLHYRIPAAEQPLSGRIHEFIAQRLELYEAVAPVRRAALVNAHRSGAIRKQLRSLAHYGARLLTETFAPELASLPQIEQTALIHALDLSCSFEAWDRLRRVQKLSATEAQTTLVTLVQGCLAQALGKAIHT